MSREKEINAILIELKNAVEGIKGVGLVSIQGLLISKVFNYNINSRLFAGITASIVGPANRIAQSLFETKGFSTTTVTTDKGSVIISDLKSSILVVLTEGEPNIGLILFEMERIAGKIKEVMNK